MVSSIVGFEDAVVAVSITCNIVFCFDEGSQYLLFAPEARIHRGRLRSPRGLITELNGKQNEAMVFHLQRQVGSHSSNVNQITVSDLSFSLFACCRLNDRVVQLLTLLECWQEQEIVTGRVGSCAAGTYIINMVQLTVTL